MFDANVHDFEVHSTFYIQKCGTERREIDELNLKSTYHVENQTLLF